MTSNSPEEIRRDIEATRRELSRDVDAFTEKVSPARVAQRRVDRARGAVTNVKEKVMGVHSTDSTSSNGGRLSSAGDSVSSAASSVSSSVSDAGSTVADAASSAPDQARARTRGNPLAAGLIAFGAGWLVSSLLPATQREQDAATAVKDKAAEHADAVKAPVTEAAKEIKDNLRGPAQDAVGAVRSTAQDGVDNVRGEAHSAAGDVAGQAHDSRDAVAQPQY
jgi:hypothetical protein